MFRRLRENGPALLVPAAWTLALAAHTDVVGRESVTIAHAVMVVVIALFALLSWRDMADDPILQAWRLVLLVGLPVTLAGLIALVGAPVGGSLALSIVGWMLLPAPALVYTGRRVGPDEYPLAYLAGAALAVLGAVVYVGGLVRSGSTPAAIAGIVLVGVGQTAGIVAAVVRY